MACKQIRDMYPDEAPECCLACHEEIVFGDGEEPCCLLYAFACWKGLIDPDANKEEP